MAHYVMDFFKNIYHRLSSLSSARLVETEPASSEQLHMQCELQIRKCQSTEDLYDSLSRCFYLLFPETNYCHVYINTNALEDVYGNSFPSEGLASQIVHYKDTTQNLPLKLKDPLHALLKDYVEPRQLSKFGLSFIPILHPTEYTLLACILFVGEKLILDAEALDLLSLLTTSTADTCINMQSHYYGSAFSLLSQLSKIDDNIAQSQLTVVQHLKQETGADSGFLLAYNKHDDDFILKTFDNKLVPEKRFPCQDLPTFTANLKLSKPQLTIYTRELKRDIVMVGGRVPAEQCMIAPIKQNTGVIGFVVLLSLTKSKFTRENLALVQAILTLSGSMIYKDMIVERERTLRKKTERLHQVAKNIFTHLGSHFGQLIADSYRRLIDLVAIPELPSPIQATHGSSHYKNIFLPPIDCQRLISLDNNLLIIGPRSIRHSNAPEAFRKRSIRDEGSEDTGMSSVINSYETGHIIVDMPPELPYETGDYIVSQPMSLSVVREKREPAGPNLGYISEETEASVIDTVLTNASGLNRDSSRFRAAMGGGRERSVAGSSLGQELRVDDGGTPKSDRIRPKRKSREAKDRNNNADKEETPKKRGGVGSKFNMRPSRHVVPQAFGSQPSTSNPPDQNNDVMAQILGMSADAGGTPRPTRGNSSIGVNQRPSTFGMSGNMPGSRMNVNYRGGRGTSVMKVTSKKSMAHTGQPIQGSVLDVLQRGEQARMALESLKEPEHGELNRKSSAKREPSRKSIPNEGRNMSQTVLAEPKPRKSIAPRGLSNTNEPLMPLDEIGTESRRPSVSDTPNVPIQSSAMSGTGSDFTAVSTGGSKNDSEESLDLKNFQAALKRDLRMHHGQTTLVDREKTMMQSILEYRRRSILEEKSSCAEGRDSHDSEQEKNANEGVSKTSKVSVAELRLAHDTPAGHQKSSLNLSKESNEKKEARLSHEVMGALPNTGNKTLKQGSHISLMDVSAKVHKPSIARKLDVSNAEGTHKKSMPGDSSQPVRKSVMNLDSRAKDANDSRFAYADRIERTRSQIHRFSVSTPSSNFNELLMSAADATAGPFRKRTSNMDTPIRGRISVVDAKAYGSVSPARLATPRCSTAISGGKSAEEVNQSGHKVESKGSKTQYKSCGVQHVPKTHNAQLQTSMSTLANAICPSIEILTSPSPMRMKRMSEQSFAVRSQPSQNELTRIKARRSSSLDRHGIATLKRRSLASHHRATLVEAPDASLIPLISPVSGTVLPTMTTITTARSHSKKPSFPTNSGETLHPADSDIDTLLYNNLSAYHGIKVNAGDHKRKKSRRVEVKCVNTVNSEFELFTWRWTTMKILKLAPVTHCFGVDENDLTNLLKEIMQEARNITNAEKCSVFLMESDVNELVAKVFDGDIVGNEEVRISATEGIAGHVVQTGKILNIKDAYSHPLFYRGVDESTGFKTRSILCFPIKDERDNIIGAAQLCNKIDSPYFTSIDEDIARALATYCCISIVHSLMYRDVLDAHNRVKLANELMVFHMHVPPQDVVELIKQPILPLTSGFGDNLHLNDLIHSVPRYVNLKDMPTAVVSMFHELDFVQNFRIKPHTLARFILMVRKGYRDPPYHNWNHAFSVAHFSYLILKNLSCVAAGILDDLEALAYFVAALCHDIDHRGTSNSFQVASKSVLAALYSSEGSVMERHHFSQTMCILNTEGCNIFENVSRKEYEQLLDLIRDIILSTDIAHHLRIRAGLEGMAEEGFDKNNGEHKSLILCLFMTCADLSDQTKNWGAAKRVSKMLYKEFFSQGDLEKALGRNPMEMMDRERASIPNLQIGFIDFIVLPAFNTLSSIFSETSGLVSNIENNREHWITIKNKAADKRGSITSLEVFDFIDAEDEKENEANGHSQNGEAVPNGAA